MLVLMKALYSIAFILVVVGALNWGLVGLGFVSGVGDWNLVHLLFGAWPIVEAAVYVIVGLSAVLVMIGSGRALRR